MISDDPRLGLSVQRVGNGGDKFVDPFCAVVDRTFEADELHLDMPDNLIFIRLKWVSAQLI